MKIWVCRTSEYSGDGAKRDFKTLDECIKTLEKETGVDEYVVCRPLDWMKGAKDCEWQVEIYDTWRE